MNTQSRRIGSDPHEQICCAVRMKTSADWKRQRKRAMREWTREEKYRVLKDPQELWQLHEKTVQSDFRQTYHIQSVTGLMNDPNGFVWHDNKWHLFYQWCPWGAVHGLKYWYHIVSSDLVTWKNLGVCLMPDREYDNKGAYSGSAMPIGDSLYLYYTGNSRDENWVRHPYTCLAKLRDDGWTEKYPLPLFGPNPDYTEHQRDPKIIYVPEKHSYYIILGAQTKDKKGCALIYRSEDLLHGWVFAGQLKVPGFEDFGDMWECPTIEKIGGKEILMFCPQHLEIAGRGGSRNHNGYIIGNMDWDSLTFQPVTRFHVLDFGFDSYAAACANNVRDPEKAILVAWMGLPDSSYPTDEEDWQGCLTLPRELRSRCRSSRNFVTVKSMSRERKTERSVRCRVSVRWNFTAGPAITASVFSAGLPGTAACGLISVRTDGKSQLTAQACRCVLMRTRVNPERENWTMDLRIFAFSLTGAASKSS